MQLIKSLSEIDYKNPSTLSFMATVISVDSDGDEERKKPFKATLKLEESGELTQVNSWKFENLELFKKLVFTDDVYCFEGTSSLYKDTEKQIRIGEIRAAGLKSTKKILKTVNSEEIKREIMQLMNTYIPVSGQFSVYKTLITELVFKNEKFWTWPAATRVHHAYPGGLAKHTLNTLKNALSIWGTYNGGNMNSAVITAGAILHDIGKLTEYNEDGSRTKYGDLIPHPISGYSKVFRKAEELGLDPEKSSPIIMLLHTILSHHEKLEYGAASQPGILEALVVARADALDASIESVDAKLNNLEVNNSTERMIFMENMSFLKWHT